MATPGDGYGRQAYRGARSEPGKGAPWQGGEVSISASVGVCMLDKARFSGVDEWIASADRALYRAKREGRNRVELVSA